MTADLAIGYWLSEMDASTRSLTQNGLAPSSHGCRISFAISQASRWRGATR